VRRGRCGGGGAGVVIGVGGGDAWRWTRRRLRGRGRERRRLTRRCRVIAGGCGGSGGGGGGGHGHWRHPGTSAPRHAPPPPPPHNHHLARKVGGEWMSGSRNGARDRALETCLARGHDVQVMWRSKGTYRVARREAPSAAARARTVCLLLYEFYGRVVGCYIAATDRANRTAAAAATGAAAAGPLRLRRRWRRQWSRRWRSRRRARMIDGDYTRYVVKGSQA
jgi:hypothetical protein